MKPPIPDFAWYSAESTRLGLKSPRCPFASVNACPRYYQSLSLLGGAGCTSIPKAEDDALRTKWGKHPLWPATGEQSTGIAGPDGNPKDYRNFCPEVSYDRFGVFATFLNAYFDESARSTTHQLLADMEAADDHPRWNWASIRAQHYSECPIYSPLTHSWPKLLASSPGPGPTSSLSSSVRFDVFISHASEDKDDFVRGLAAELTRLGLKVWFDETTLTLGDSLRAKIDQGLACSDYGVVVLSHHFFNKNWPQAELGALFAREMQGRKVILPVRHGLTQKDVIQYSPLLADKLATLTDRGVEAVAAEIHAVVRPSAATPAPQVSKPAKPISSNSVIHKGGRFQVELGNRHRHVREEILGINPRRMADFYGFEKVAQLEACERGDDEFPTAAIKKLREFFFVSRQYLEGEYKQVFDSFDVVCSADDCKKFIGEGFHPFLLCLNEDRENLWCWLVFHKEQDGFDRIITANAHGYFASSGGGKSNVMHLIEAAHHHGLGPYDISVQRADRKMWDKLDTWTFYLKGLGSGTGRGPDDDGQDCFLAWWKEFEEEQARIKNHKRKT